MKFKVSTTAATYKEVMAIAQALVGIVDELKIVAEGNPDGKRLTVDYAVQLIAEQIEADRCTQKGLINGYI